MRVFIGIVGYFGFIRSYPLGPELMQRLRAIPWSTRTEISELNWGPVAIVQDFQARAERPDVVVLVGAIDRGLPSASVHCRRWIGGTLDALAVQRRMFEAVTGVISLDNLLVIGSQFGVWPERTFTVELQWPESGLGDLVLAELERDAGRGRVVGEGPLSDANDRLVTQLVDAVRKVTGQDGGGGAVGDAASLPTLSVADLTAVATVTHHRFVETPGVLQ